MFALSRRPHLARFDKLQTAEQELKDDQLAKDVLVATFKHLMAQLDHDLCIVEAKLSQSKDVEAAEGAKDAKFLQDRQARLGYSSNTISTFCRLVRAC